MPEKCGERIREIRKRAGLRQAEFANRLNVSVVTINRIENGHRHPDTRMVLNLSEDFGVDPTWLLLGRKSTGSEYACFAPIYDDEELRKEESNRRVKGRISYPGISDNCFSWEMSDDAMTPKIRPGDFLLILDEHVKAGDVVLFLDEFGLVHVRQLGLKENEPCLIATNPEYPVQMQTAEHQILGKIKSVIRQITPAGGS